MHSQREFFHTVLSGEGKPCLAWLVKAEPKNYFKHKVFDSVDQFCDTLDKIDFTKNNFYFCVSTLKEESLTIGEKKRVRVQQNTLKSRSFILDVDIRPDKPGHYGTIEEGLEGIRKVAETFNMPDPIIVHSGYGLHVYWPMAEGVDSDEWTQVAKKFKRAIEMIAPEVVADGSRVSDSAGVLRIPASFNLKNDTLTPVKIIQWYSDVLDFGAFNKLLSRITGTSTDNKPLKTANVTATTYTESEPSDLASTARNCNWVGQYLKNKATASEPEWYAMLGLVPYLTYKSGDKEISGSALAHAISKGHEAYDPEATYLKYNQARTAQTGPTTCAKLASINAERCKGCPFAATVKSPIQAARLARPATEAATVAATVVDENGNRTEEEVVIPLPPAPYFRGETGGVFLRKKTKNEDTGEWDEIIDRVYDYDVYPTKRMRTESHENEAMEVHLWLPKDGLRKFRLPNGLLADNKKLNQFLSEKGVVAEHGKAGGITKFLIDYVRHLQMSQAAEVEFSRFGWRDTLSAEPKFILGDGYIDRTGQLIPSASASFLKDAAKATVTHGTLEKWKEGFNVYNHIPGSEPYILAAMLGFAAPLMAFTEYSGVLYNMVGHSAAGKSTALKVMTSVWGQPNPQHVLVSDTEISIFNFIGYLNNVPVAFDELTKMDGDKLSNFALHFTGGRGKMRASRDGTNRQNETFWDTIVCGTSNTSMYDKLASSRRGYSAEAMRIFELPVGESDNTYKGHVDRAIALLRDNHGHAGREYIKYIIPRALQIRAMLDKAISVITAKGQLRNEERFWGALLACVLIGGKISRDILKLHTYNVEGVVDYALGLSSEVRAAVQTTISDPVSTLAEFFNSNLDSLLKMNNNQVDLGSLNNTMRSVKARLEYVDGQPHTAYVSIAAIREYCKQRNIDPSWLRRELMDAGVITNDSVQFRLTSGTNLPKVNCKNWQIDLNHPKLIGTIEDTKNG